MKRLPALRRKETYIAEIDAARKRQKVYEERKDPFGDYEEEFGDVEQPYEVVEASPIYANKLTSRYRVVQRKCLTHDPEHYQRASAAISASHIIPSTSKNSNYFAGYHVHPNHRVQSANYLMYGDIEDYHGDDFGNDVEVSTSSAMYDAPPPSLPPRARILQKNNFKRSGPTQKNHTHIISGGPVSDEQTRETVGSAFHTRNESDQVKIELNRGQRRRHTDEIADEFEEDYDNIERNVSVDVTANEIPTRSPSAADGYEYFEAENGEVQEQVEVVEDDVELDEMINEGEIDPMDHSHHFHSQPFKFSGAGPIDMYKLFELMGNQRYRSNEELMESFLSDPAMSYPLNVAGLMAAARNASPELNAQAIASLAMQVNYLKKDLTKLRQDVTDLRAVCLSQDNPFFSPGRRFEPLAEVSKDWKIPAIPPLGEVDLVALARQLGNIRTGKRTIRNEDLIRRYVRIVLEQLVPRHMVREFTVRDRERSRDGHPQDIGDFAKNQIIGVVLDLMGLHYLDELDNRARAERAYYFQLTNRLMKSAIYDMRRTTPKKRGLY